MPVFLPGTEPYLNKKNNQVLINHKNLHVRGYKEEGTTTTPIDMTVLNDTDCYHLVMDVIDRVPMLGIVQRILSKQCATN